MAQKVGVDIENALWNQSKEDKLDWIKDKKKETGKPVVMMGDSKNDEHAIGEADVGIQIFRTRDVEVMSNAKIVLKREKISKEESDDFRNLEFLFSVAKNVNRILFQNYMIIGLTIIGPIIIGLLGFVPLSLAVILHEGGTFLVILNSMRLYWM